MPKIFKPRLKIHRKANSDQKTGRLTFFSNSTQETSIVKTKYRVASCQSTGKERSHNEDTLFVMNTCLSGLDVPIAFGLYLVADGMGGHQSGELASNLAAQGISQYLLKHIFQAALFERKKFSSSDLKKHLRIAFDEAQALVVRRVPGGGTTLTLVLVLEDDFITAHVGDSRLYQVGKDGSLKLMTRDHSLVKRLVDLGEISEGDADIHPQRNVLYRALGQSDPFEPDIDGFSLDVGEGLLLCSDGLWGPVGQQEMQRLLQGDEDLDAKAQSLVNAANDAGGPDNISVVLVERLE